MSTALCSRVCSGGKGTRGTWCCKCDAAVSSSTPPRCVSLAKACVDLMCVACFTSSACYFPFGDVQLPFLYFLKIVVKYTPQSIRPLSHVEVCSAVAVHAFTLHHRHRPPAGLPAVVRRVGLVPV